MIMDIFVLIRRIFLNILKGIVTNMFHPLYGLGHALMVFAFLIRYEVISVNDYGFLIPLNDAPIWIVLIASTAYTVFWAHYHLFDNDRKLVRIVGMSLLPIVGTAIFSFSFIMGTMSVWISISILESETPPDDFILFAFSAWTFIMSWYLRQFLIGADGKSGGINQFWQFMYRRFPALDQLNKRLTYATTLALYRIIPINMGPQKILRY